MGEGWLILAGGLSAAAAVLHIGCIVGGPSWYRFFGAGEGMARLAEKGSLRPPLITSFIAAVLFGWAAYAFSGSGLFPRLPLVKTVLALITAAYLIRALALPVMLARMRDRSPTFLIWSSAVVLVIGIVHAVGTAAIWSGLGAGW